MTSNEKTPDIGAIDSAREDRQTSSCREGNDDIGTFLRQYRTHVKPTGGHTFAGKGKTPSSRDCRKVDFRLS
jgi:hypothetical protein